MMFMEAITENMTTEYETFNGVVELLVERAKQDLMAEGLPVDQAIFSLELDMLYGGQVNVKRMASPHLYIRSENDARDVYEAFELEFSEAFSPLVVNKPGGVYLDSYVLRVSVPTQKVELAELPITGADASAARTGTRQAYWPEYAEYVETTVYSFDELQPGNRFVGPAIVEADLTTVVVAPEQTFSIDKYGLGILEGNTASTPQASQTSSAVSVRDGARSEIEIQAP